MPKSVFRSLLIGLLWMICAACAANLPQGQIKAAPSVKFSDCHLSSSRGILRQTARCARLAVYENPASAAGRQIELNIAVIPAISRSPAPDALFFIPGGPGEAATTSFPSLAGAFTQINQKRDIVLVDQRGTGESNALKCPEAANEDTAASESQAQVKQSVQRCLAEVSAKSDPKLYTTAIAVSDLDQARAALGYAHINLYGGSYGTRVALAYMRQYPERVRSVILDGVTPMDWTLGPSVAADAQRALDLIFARCAAEQACQKAFPDLPAEFQALQAQLADQPAKGQVADPLTGEQVAYEFTREDFVSTVHTLSYTPETAALLPLDLHTAYARQDFSLLAAQQLSFIKAVGESISSGMRFSVMCSEDLPFFPAEGSRGYYGDYFLQTFRQICNVWPQGQLPSGFKEAVRSNAPTLLLSGETDPVTPPANAAQAAQTLPNSLQIVAPGQGHINIYRGCITRLAAQFVEQGAVSGLDAACVRNLRPMQFFVNFNGPRP